MRDIESRQASIKYWERAAAREELAGNKAAAITFRNMAWLLEHPEGWVAFIRREKVQAALSELTN